MTTYPLSEPATIYRAAGASVAERRPDDVVARGTLSECAEILEGWSADDRATVRIDVEQMDLAYGPDKIEELLEFLRHEGDD